MKRNKTKVLLLFGGMSEEHDVSIESAKAIHENLDRARYQPLLVYITRAGEWCRIDEEVLEKCGSYAGSHQWQDMVSRKYSAHSFIPWRMSDNIPLTCDIAFPVLHGPNGEDGKIQAMLELAGIPFVGANSYASALAMDKYISKILFARAGLPTPDFRLLEKPDTPGALRLINADLGYPVFVKPCSLGSSIGISKVAADEELPRALETAFKHDRRVLIERAIPAREIEISVMGNDDIRISKPGELIPHREFYDYTDKYLENRTRFILPASLPPDTEQRLRAMAETAYRSLFLNGMARIDFFIEKASGEIYINEINTIPGFTTISMFPKLWELEAISFSRLLDHLIELGFEYAEKRVS